MLVICVQSYPKSIFYQPEGCEDRGKTEKVEIEWMCGNCELSFFLLFVDERRLDGLTVTRSVSSFVWSDCYHQCVSLSGMVRWG